jgi:hypothetical protein
MTIKAQAIPIAGTAQVTSFQSPDNGPYARFSSCASRTTRYSLNDHETKF